MFRKDYELILSPDAISGACKNVYLNVNGLADYVKLSVRIAELSELSDATLGITIRGPAGDSIVSKWGVRSFSYDINPKVHGCGLYTIVIAITTATVDGKVVHGPPTSWRRRAKVSVEIYHTKMFMDSFGDKVGSQVGR